MGPPARGRGTTRYRLGAGTALGVLLATVAVGASGATACSTHQCDGTLVCVYPYPGFVGITCPAGAPVITMPPQPPVRHEDGQLVWDTATLTGPWLDYGPEVTLQIFYPDELGHQLPTSVQAWLSTDVSGESDPAKPYSARNFVNASGQLAEYVYIDPNAVNVLNGTCASYGLRIEVTVPEPVAPPSTPQDGGAKPMDASSAATEPSEAETGG